MQTGGPMDYTKFYTPPEIAYLLVQQLNISFPSEVVDICCGSCNLLHAAGARWPRAKLIGVDIVSHTSIGVTCTKSDGRKFALDHTGEFPLVLANPPFDFVSAKREFPELFNGIPADCATSRLEIEMLFANLRILKESGTLMIIVPSTLVTAEGYRKIRKYLSKNYHIQRIIHLPDDTFGSSNISSCALVIKREKLSQHYTRRFYVTHNNNGYSISKGTNIPQALVRSGDWDTVAINASKKVYNFRRGNISSHYFKETGVPILHTAKIEDPWKPSKRYISIVPSNAVYAEENDIIVSRIGKSAGQWFQYHGSPIPVSDCLYVLKDPDGSIFEKVDGKQYPYQPKGVATRYITITDFSSWLSSL